MISFLEVLALLLVLLLFLFLVLESRAIGNVMPQLLALIASSMIWLLLVLAILLVKFLLHELLEISHDKCISSSVDPSSLESFLVD